MWACTFGQGLLVAQRAIPHPHHDGSVVSSYMDGKRDRWSNGKRRWSVLNNASRRKDIAGSTDGFRVPDSLLQTRMRNWEPSRGTHTVGVMKEGEYPVTNRCLHEM